MFIFRTFKKLAFALSVPAVLAVSGWAQWTALTADGVTVAVSTTDASRADVLPERSDTSAADPRIKAATVLERTAEGDAQPSAPAVKATAELVQKKIVTYRIKPAPIPDRTAGTGAQPSAPVARADTELAQADTVTYPRIEPAPIPDRTAGSGAQPSPPAVKADAELAQADTVTYPRIEPAPIPDRTAGNGAQPPAPAVKADTELAQADAVTYPRIKPAPIPDRTAGSGAQPPAPAVKADTEFAQATAAPLGPSIEPAPAAERGSGEKVALAEQEPPLANGPSTIRSSTTETKKERQAALSREAKEDRSTRDREREAETRRSRNDAANARKVVVPKRQMVEHARLQWSGPATFALRDHPMRLRAPMAWHSKTCW
jgi:hypothetical protein